MTDSGHMCLFWLLLWDLSGDECVDSSVEVSHLLVSFYPRVEFLARIHIAVSFLKVTSCLVFALDVCNDAIYLWVTHFCPESSQKLGFRGNGWVFFCWMITWSCVCFFFRLHRQNVAQRIGRFEDMVVGEYWLFVGGKHRLFEFIFFDLIFDVL